MDEVRILIADDHEIIHRGIEDILRNETRYFIEGHAYDGEEAVKLALELKPDIIFMDISMPLINGVEATKIISQKLPGVKIIALTQHEESEYITQMLLAGSHAYLPKNSKKEDLCMAMETVLSGQRYIGQKLSGEIINILSSYESKRIRMDSVKFTRREIEILQKIADDKSNQIIAEELNISLRTVETHRRNMMQKMDVKTVVAMLKYALTNNLIQIK